MLFGRQEGHPACKKLSGVAGCWHGYLQCCLQLLVACSSIVTVGVVLSHGVLSYHGADLMPLPLTVSCVSEIQIGYTFLVPAHSGSPGKGPLNGCVFMIIMFFVRKHVFCEW